MQFTYSTDKSSLYDDIDYLCGSTSATYPILDKRRNIYNAYNDVSRQIWEVANGWQYDDSNRVNLPIAHTTLVHNQQDYALPTNAQRIERVEVEDSNGNWVKLAQLDTRDLSVSISEFENSAGLPKYYDLIGTSLMLYPKPASGSCTLASGLAVIVSRDVSAFASASTAEPGFARPFHRLLSLAAALDFTQDPQQRNRFLLMKDRLEKGLVRFYSKRNEEYRTIIKPYAKSRWQRYL
jgi:hypothetical protein